MSENLQQNKISSSVYGFFGLFLGFFIMISTILNNPYWHVLDFYGKFRLLEPIYLSFITNSLIASIIYFTGRRYFQNFSRGFLIGVLIALMPMVFIWFLSGIWLHLLIRQTW